MNFPQLASIPPKRAWRRRERYTETCRNCGAEFQCGESHGRHQTGAKFCSARCQHLWGWGKSPLELSPTNAAYLAAMIDGDGSIMLMRRSGPTDRHHLVVNVSNTAVNLMAWLKVVVGAGHVVKASNNRPHQKMCYLWMIYGRPAEEVLRQIRPYLVIKTVQADLVLSFQHRRRELLDEGGEWQAEAVTELHRLNKRGVA